MYWAVATIEIGRLRSADSDYFAPFGTPAFPNSFGSLPDPFRPSLRLSSNVRFPLSRSQTCRSGNHPMSDISRPLANAQSLPGRFSSISNRSGRSGTDPI